MFRHKYRIDIVTTYKCSGSIHEKESVSYGNSIRNLLKSKLAYLTHTHTVYLQSWTITEKSAVKICDGSRLSSGNVM
jgi:hypothetical protein